MAMTSSLMSGSQDVKVPILQPLPATDSIQGKGTVLALKASPISLAPSLLRTASLVPSALCSL